MQTRILIGPKVILFFVRGITLGWTSEFWRDENVLHRTRFSSWSWKFTSSAWKFMQREYNIILIHIRRMNLDPALLCTITILLCLLYFKSHVKCTIWLMKWFNHIAYPSKEFSLYITVLAPWLRNECKFNYEIE